MARQVLTVRIRVSGLESTLNAFRRLPRVASDALRDRTWELSETLARRAAAAAAADTPQTALVAPTVKAVRDRVPAITAGGSRRVGRRRARASDLVFAGEFGQKRRSGWYAKARYGLARGRQWRPHRGNNSYWFFKTVSRNESEIGAAWLQVADDVITDWSRRG